MSVLPSREERKHREYERIERLPYFPKNQTFDAFRARLEELRDGGKNIVIASVEGWKGFDHEPCTEKGFVLFLPGEGKLRAIVLTTWKNMIVEVGPFSEEQITFFGFALASLHFTKVSLLQDATQDFFETGGWRILSLNLVYEIYELLKRSPLRNYVSREIARCPVLTEGLPQEIADFKKEAVDPALEKIKKLEQEIEALKENLKPAEEFIALIKEC